MKGYIYIMSNPSFIDGRLKIGMTGSKPNQRKNELYSTGVPEPFKIDLCTYLLNFHPFHYKHIADHILSRLVVTSPQRNG